MAKKTRRMKADRVVTWMAKMIDIPEFEKQDIIHVRVQVSEVYAAAAFPKGDFVQVQFLGEIKHAMTREKDRGSYGQGYSFDELKHMSFEANSEEYSEVDDMPVPERFSGDYFLNIEEKYLYIDLKGRHENFKTVLSILALSTNSRSLELVVNLKPNDDQKIKLTYRGLVYSWSLSNKNNYLNNE